MESRAGQEEEIPGGGHSSGREEAELERKGVILDQGGSLCMAAAKTWSGGKVYPHKPVPSETSRVSQTRTGDDRPYPPKRATTTHLSLVFSGGNVESLLTAFLIFQETLPGQVIFFK